VSNKQATGKTRAGGSPQGKSLPSLAKRRQILPNPARPCHARVPGSSVGILQVGGVEVVAVFAREAALFDDSRPFADSHHAVHAKPKVGNRKSGPARLFSFWRPSPSLTAVEVTAGRVDSPASRGSAALQQCRRGMDGRRSGSCRRRKRDSLN
jgi:hypothetical protein